MRMIGRESIEQHNNVPEVLEKARQRRHGRNSTLLRCSVKVLIR